MKLLGLFALLIAGTAYAVSNDLEIPPEYRHGSTVTVQMVDSQEELEKVCEAGGINPVAHQFILLGCVPYKDASRIVVINPCLRKDEADHSSFAHLMCHEKAHIFGWTHPVP